MNYVLVPRLPRDHGYGKHVAGPMIKEYWQMHRYAASWANRRFGATCLCPQEEDIKALGRDGLDKGQKLLVLLRHIRPWREMGSWHQDIELALDDFNLVKDQPWEELLWYAFLAFRAIIEVYQVLHAMDIPPENRVHNASHEAYEPFLQIAFRDHNNWRT